MQIAFWKCSSSSRSGFDGFTCEKLFIGHIFGKEKGNELKFGTHKELINLNILECKYSVGWLLNNCQIDDGFKKKDQAITLLLFILSNAGTSRLE